MAYYTDAICYGVVRYVGVREVLRPGYSHNYPKVDIEDKMTDLFTLR